MEKHDGSGSSHEKVAKSAYCKHDPVTRSGQPGGALEGLRFAAKDLFELRGRVACCGNPEWLRTHVAADADAPVIEALISAGAELAGTTVMDELAYSLAGINAHYGTPINSAAAGRVCGGSSCGSAAAVAGGLVDFAVGTDTGGSVRVPASYCGLFGLRPSHDLIPTRGMTALAPSFDTVGLLTAEAHVMQRTAQQLLAEPAREAPASTASRLLLAQDVFDELDDAVFRALQPAIEQCAQQLGLSVVPIQAAPDGLDACVEAFRRIQAREAWRCHGEWVEREKPCFGPGVRERFAAAQELSETPAHRDEDEATRSGLTKHLQAELAEGGLLLLPPAVGPAPRVDAEPAALEDFRARTLRVSCLAALARIPQLAFPAIRFDEAPVGLSLAAATGADELLLTALHTLTKSD